MGFRKLFKATIFLGLLLSLGTGSAEARGKLQGWAEQGGQRISTAGFSSSHTAQRSYPGCTVTIYVSGTSTLATLYSDAAGTPKANPFTSGSDASWEAYVDDGDFDVRFSGTGITTPWTLGALRIIGGALTVNVTTFGAQCNWNGTTGNDDTAEIQAAIDFAENGTSFTPTGGSFMGSAPTVIFPDGRCKVSDALNFDGNPVVKVKGDDTIIEQTDVTKNIFVFTDGFTVDVTGIRFQGGNRQIVFTNDNTNASQLNIDDCEFSLSEDYAVFAVGTSTAKYTTGTVTSTGSLLTGSGTLWATAASNGGVDPNQHESAGCSGGFCGWEGLDIHFPTTDEYYRIADITNDTSLRMNRAIQTAVNGVAYEIGDFHLSANIHVSNSKFMRPEKAIFTAADSTVFTNVWVQIDKDNFVANTAAIKNFAGNFYGYNFFGVPEMGTEGVDRISFPRWFDLEEGGIYCTNCRLGGEEAGMNAVWNHAPYFDVSPFNWGGKISFINSDIYAGPSANTFSGVVVLRANSAGASRENIPQMIVYKWNYGHTATPVINNQSGVDVTLAGVSLATEKFRYDIGPNQTGTDTTGMPNGLYKFTGIRRGAGALNFGSLEPVDAAPGNGNCQTLTLGTLGAQIGDPVSVDDGNNVLTGSNFQVTAYVSAADTVSITVCNIEGAIVDPASGTFTVFARNRAWLND